MTWHGKLRTWFRRYGPAEALSLLTTLVPAWWVLHTTGNRAAAAWTGTWVGNAGYFGTLLWMDVRLARQARRAAGKRYSPETLGRNLRALVAEFGFAELLDSLVIRPALLYYSPLWVQPATAGLLVGKLVADVLFYIPVIVAYEWSTRRGWRRFD